MALTQPQPSTRYTYEFVRANLPPGAARILEVGCGDGALAALLQADGLKVVAIDLDLNAVEAAKSAGVDARLIEWPASVGLFDAVMFTRSLHHISALGRAIAAASDALRPGGRIIVEDFRAEGGSEAGSEWFSELARSLIADGALTPEMTLEDLLEKLAPADHDHELHSSSAIAEALGGFDSVVTDAAYYFRYLEPHLREPTKAQELFDQELSLIADGSIEALGKRFVAFGR